MTRSDLQLVTAGSALTGLMLAWAPGWIGLACAVSLAFYWCWLLETPHEP